MPINKDQVTSIAEHFLRVTPMIVLIVIGAILLNIILRRLLGLLAHKTSLTPREIGPARTLINWLIYLAALVFILQAFGFNIGGLWGMLSTLFAMVAIGFVAMWSILSNSLCTVLILIFRPFSVGDEIEFPGEPVKGRVIDLNFIYTTIEVEPGVVIQIPNNFFFQKNLKRRHSAASISLADQLRTKAPQTSQAEEQAALRAAIASPTVHNH